VAAARGDQLDTLKYLLEKGCDWHRDAVSEAARNGNFTMVGREG
jgi:hypothetical protein